VAENLHDVCLAFAEEQPRQHAPVGTYATSPEKHLVRARDRDFGEDGEGVTGSGGPDHGR